MFEEVPATVRFDLTPDFIDVVVFTGERSVRVPDRSINKPPL